MDYINEKIQSAYEDSILEKKTFVSAYWLGNALVWKTSDGRSGSDPMKKTKDKKALLKHFKKVLGSNVELELIKESKEKIDESEGKGLSNDDVKKLKDIIGRLVIANFQAHGDLQKAKKQAFSRLHKESPKVLAAFLKKAISMKEELDESWTRYHMFDNILDEISVKELLDTVYSNVPSEKLNPKSVQKEYDTLLKMKLRDAKSMIKKAIPEIIKEVEDNRV